MIKGLSLPNELLLRSLAIHDHIINFIIKRRSHFEAIISRKTVDSVADFIFGYSIASGMTDHLLKGFRIWLGVELKFFRPSALRGGIWIGPVIGWQTMLIRYYENEKSAYDGFFIHYSDYACRARDIIKSFDLTSSVKETLIIPDWGSGFPIALVAYRVDGHSGVYVESNLRDGAFEQVGYFSTIDEVENAVRATMNP